MPEPSRAKRSIAVLLASHNRREKTLRCLASLRSQEAISEVFLSVFVVDDGSTDGTADAIAKRFPDVLVISGNGSLYWGGAMRYAMNAATQSGFDFYLWLNDDIELYHDAIGGLLRTYDALRERGQEGPAIVGALCDPVSRECTYGGAVRSSRWHPLRFRRIAPGLEPQPCDVFNGNVVLISRHVVNVVGNLNPALPHTAGDFDYALRIAQHGFSSWVAPGFVGECTRNSTEGTWLDTTLPLPARYRLLLGPKAYPVRARTAYFRAHAGALGPALGLMVYIMLPFKHCFAKLASRLRALISH